MTDQETQSMNQVAKVLSMLMAYSCSAMKMSNEEMIALVKDMECGRVELLFKTRMGRIQTTFSGYLVYPDGREVLCFEDTAAHLPAVHKGDLH